MLIIALFCANQLKNIKNFNEFAMLYKAHFPNKPLFAKVGDKVKSDANYRSVLCKSAKKIIFGGQKCQKF